MCATILVAVFFCWLPATAVAQRAPSRVAPQSPSGSLSATLDKIVRGSIAADEIPGAVLLVSRRGRLLHRRAYGSRAILPQREPMTVDTIFDLASLTKVVATTSAVMKLIEQGKVRLNDPVVRYIPKFAASGKDDGKDQVTVRHLMIHFSGLPPIPSVNGGGSSPAPVRKAIYETPLISPPGMRFVYSDCDYIILGEIVQRASGMPLDEFVDKEIFAPLGMRHTRFLPLAGWKPRIAPTEEIDLPEGAKAGSGRGRVLRGGGSHEERGDSDSS